MLSKNFFIVEDNNLHQTLYRQILEYFGYNIVGIVDNGEDAVCKYKSFSTKPDIILMNYNMPRKNGIEATKEIIKINPESKIIMTSTDFSIEAIAISRGASCFMQKPLI